MALKKGPFWHIISSIIIFNVVMAFPVFADEPYGAAAITRLDRLPYLFPGVTAGQQSSFDRGDNNGDSGNFLYSTNGENVMLDLKVPGVVYYIWTTGFNYASDHIKAYFDGETVPRLDMLMGNFFSGTSAQFPAPLSVNNIVSSGGFCSYVPLPFARSIRITTTGSSYYHVGYHTFATDAQITSWTPSQDISLAKSVWQNTGADPKPLVTSTTSVSSFGLGIGQTQTLLDIDGPRSIQSLRIKISSLAGMGSSGSIVTDNGRAFKGHSQFSVQINPTNKGVRLQRRLDYGIADQTANVTVDGVAAGQWSDPGSASGYWKNSSFTIASNLTSGKSLITIRITFVSSAVDWNEFYYWAYNENMDGSETLSDSLDVGTAGSETTHSYSISNQTWNGTRTYQYLVVTSASMLDVLNNIGLKITYDHSITPSVDAPLGFFFAIGHFGASTIVRSLMAGVDNSDYLYCYFPMPFAQHCTVKLTNGRSVATPGITTEIRHSVFPDSFSNVGYFNTWINHEVHIGNDGNDVLFLDTAGAGKLVGFVESMEGATSRVYLEGNERFYVDNCRSVGYNGTGTEDFYNAGWYFQGGTFSLQMSGNSFHTVDTNDKTTAYRFLLQDAVGFRTHVHASIQHGSVDDAQEEAWTLAYFYQKPMPSAVLCDTLDIGNPASETAHGFTMGSLTWSGSNTSFYEGAYDTVSIGHKGKNSTGDVSFTATILPGNSGVMIRRMYNQQVQPQQADVLVDGVGTGTWYTAGENTTYHWREDEFMIPASQTSGKSQLQITLRHAPGTPDWNQFEYWVYSLVGSGVASSPSKIIVSEAITNVTWKKNPSKPVPGATISVKIVCTNGDTSTANKFYLYEPIPGCAIYVSNSSFNPSGWSNQYSTNIAPNQSFSSADYTSFQPSPKSIKWIRWGNQDFGSNTKVIMNYQAVIK